MVFWLWVCNSAFSTCEQTTVASGMEQDPNFIVVNYETSEDQGRIWTLYVLGLFNVRSRSYQLQTPAAAIR